jgi:hypothetical protein
MRRVASLVLVAALAAFALPAITSAQEDEATAKEAQRIQSLAGIRTQSALAAPVVREIAGTPLTIRVGDDFSFQVLNANVPGSGQFYPSGCAAGETADSGVFARVGSTLYSPNFDEHACGTATGNLGTPSVWVPVSISTVSGNGTSGTPFTVVVVADAGTTGLRLTMTVTYVNGDSFFRVNNVFSSTAGTINFDSFIGADIYLANSDSGIPFRDTSNSGIGGQNCGAVQTYTILFIPNTPADAYSGNGYSTVWSQIGAGSLPSTLATGCLDNGAALQWSQRSASPGSPVTINTTVSFSGFVGPTPSPTIPAFTAVVPTLSFPMMALFAVALATLGFLFMRRH